MRPKQVQRKKAAPKAGKRTLPSRRPQALPPVAVRPVVASAATSLRTVKQLKTRKFSAKERKYFRSLLMAVREQITNQVSKLKGEALTRNDSVVSEEEGTDAFDRQFALTIASSENDSLLLAEEALQKLDAGTYGICDTCGGAVELQRLKALPFVRLCIACQSDIERKKMKFRPANRQAE